MTTDRVFAQFLGAAIRRAREARGWRRSDLAERLPSGIGDRTVLSYEHGIRFVSVVRLVEIGRVVGVPGSELLRQAEVAAADLRQHSLVVNVQALARDDRDGFTAVTGWARTRSAESATVRLEPATVREMAAMLGYRHEELAAYLAEFAAHGSGG